MKNPDSKKQKSSDDLSDDILDEKSGKIDPLALGNILIDVAERAQPLLKTFLENHEFTPEETALDPLNVHEAYTEFLQQLCSNPQQLASMQMDYWQDWMNLWQESSSRFMGGEGKELFKPEKDDRRFKADVWQDSAVFDFIKQSYLLTSRWIEKAVKDTEGLDEETKNKVSFATQQFVNAMSPGNFVMTNPEVLQETLDSGGENLLRGFENLIEDMERGHGSLRISTTNHEAFDVGKNLATTPGKVIYQNDLMQLLQYEASTQKTFKRPLLIVPPWINKFYILDLRPENSFIKWLVAQGHTVFIISWVNPGRELTKKRFEDYMEEGICDALKQVKKVTGEPECNMVGYCLGGTLLAITLAWLAAKKKDNHIASVTFLASLIDFEKSGDMKVFMDEAQIKTLDKQMTEQGFLNADHMRKTFSLLRANDMIWSFVINNYLMGREPFPFDLLYWNDDATNMPAAMHNFYLRKLYHDNLLIKPDAITMNGTKINISKVKTPCYFLSTKEDHIAPWKATYAGAQILKGNTTFTLTASGHVGGVVNPPENNKYCYWSSDKIPETPDEWFNSAKNHDGSWWPHWQKWVENYAGEKCPARKIGGGKLAPIEDAPGSYVKMKAD